MKKTIIGIGFIAFSAGFGAYLVTKGNKIKRVVDKLLFKVNSVKRIRISDGKLKADIYLKIENPTDENLEFKTGVLKADTVRVYERGTKKLLAESNLQINEVTILAGGYFQLPSVSVQVPLVTGAVMAINQLANKKTNIADKLTIELDLVVLNYKKTIQIN